MYNFPLEVREPTLCWIGSLGVQLVVFCGVSDMVIGRMPQAKVDEKAAVRNIIAIKDPRQQSASAKFARMDYQTFLEKVVLQQPPGRSERWPSLIFSRTGKSIHSNRRRISSIQKFIRGDI
jgi:hypothetical protein